MSALLLLSCSESKRLHPVEPVPAIERYTGVFFTVLKKWQREHPGVSGPVLLIISARFGLLTSDTRIPYYEQRMNPARCATLATKVQSELQKRLMVKQYKRIFVNVGLDYRRVLDGFNGLSGATWATGPIGVRAGQLKAWLNEEVD